MSGLGIRLNPPRGSKLICPIAGNASRRASVPKAEQALKIKTQPSATTTVGSPGRSRLFTPNVWQCLNDLTRAHDVPAFVTIWRPATTGSCTSSLWIFRMSPALAGWRMTVLAEGLSHRADSHPLQPQSGRDDRGVIVFADICSSTGLAGVHPPNIGSRSRRPGVGSSGSRRGGSPRRTPTTSPRIPERFAE